MKEAKGEFAFGFFNNDNATFPGLDPRIGRFQFNYGHFDPFLDIVETIKGLEVGKLDREKNAEFFSDGSILSGFDAESLRLYTLANPEEVYLKDAIERFKTNKVLELKIMRCKPDTPLPEGQTCAGEEEVQGFFDAHVFMMIPLLNYIDYETIVTDSEGLPIQSVTKTELFEKINLQTQELRRINYIEHRVTLMDELFQLISSPKTFSYLNIIQESIPVISQSYDKENSYKTFVFDLALQVRVE